MIWRSPGVAVGLLVGLLSGCMRSDVLFEDPFEDPSTLTRNWIIRDVPEDPREGPSRWVIQGGRLVQRSNIYRGDREYAFYEGTRVITRTGENWTDVVVAVTLLPEDDDGVGVLFRYMDDGRFYRFFVIQDPTNGGPRMMLQARTPEGYETLAETARGYTPGTPHRVRITARGRYLRVDWDGVTVFSVEDTRYGRGRVGLQCYAQAGVAFDNVVVRKAEPITP